MATLSNGASVLLRAVVHEAGADAQEVDERQDVATLSNGASIPLSGSRPRKDLSLLPSNGAEDGARRFMSPPAALESRALGAASASRRRNCAMRRSTLTVNWTVRHLYGPTFLLGAFSPGTNLPGDSPSGTRRRLPKRGGCRECAGPG